MQSFFNLESCESHARIPRTLLVAHSDHYLLEHLVLGLEQSGFSVHVANSGISCIAKLRNMKPEVLLLDPELLWGGGDGVLASMVVCPELVSIPVLLLVTSETNMELANSLRTSVSDILALPISKSEIADRCLELVEANTKTTFDSAMQKTSSSQIELSPAKR